MRVFTLIPCVLLVLFSPAAFASEAEIELRGHISPRCSTVGEARTETAQINDFRRDGAARVAIAFSCNTAMRAVIESTNGAFINHSAGERGYAGGEAQVAYRLNVRINGAILAANLPSSLASIERGGLVLDPGLVLADRGVMQVDLNWIGSDRIYAGSYEDNLTVLIVPAM